MDPLRSEPRPPGYKAKLAGHHWIQHWDSDGHQMDLVVLQWNPGMQRWSHSGNVGTGMFVHADGATYVAECPMPGE